MNQVQEQNQYLNLEGTKKKKKSKLTSIYIYITKQTQYNNKHSLTLARTLQPPFNPQLQTQSLK